MIGGHLTSYSFINGSMGHKYYQIGLAEFGAKFQIPADFIEDFSKKRFVAEVKRHDLVFISIPKSDGKNQAADEQYSVFAIRAKNTTYLDEQETIRIYNDAFQFLLPSTLLLAGSALFIWAIKR